jgi:hypothetical protein
LDALASGEQPPVNAIQGLHQSIENDGFMMPIRDFDTEPDAGSPQQETDDLFLGADMTKAIVPVTGAQSIPYLGKSLAIKYSNVHVPVHYDLA